MEVLKTKEKKVSGLSNKILTFCLLCAVPTVYAQSTVSVYCVVDTGFGVMKGKGQQTSVQAVSGGNAASRWGLTGKEELGSGNYVKFILEQVC